MILISVRERMCGRSRFFWAILCAIEIAWFPSEGLAFLTFWRILDVENNCDRNRETLHMKTFEARSKVHHYTIACDRKVLILRFAAIGKVRSNNSDLTCDRIRPTRGWPGWVRNSVRQSKWRIWAGPLWTRWTDPRSDQGYGLEGATRNNNRPLGLSEQVRKVAERYYPENVRIFVPNFTPNQAPYFPWIFENFSCFVSCEWRH